MNYLNMAKDVASNVQDVASNVQNVTSSNTNINKPTLEDSVREYMLVAVSNPAFIDSLTSKITAIIEPILKKQLQQNGGSGRSKKSRVKKSAFQGRQTTRRHKQTSQ